MLPFLQFLIAIVAIIIAAKIGGYLSYRLGLPAVAGEVIAGLILGPSVLNFLHWPIFTDEHLGETITLLAELGVLLLMFIAGLELHLSDLARSGKVAVLTGIMGFIVPLAMGFALAIAFSFDPDQVDLPEGVVATIARYGELELIRGLRLEDVTQRLQQGHQRSRLDAQSAQDVGPELFLRYVEDTVPIGWSEQPGPRGELVLELPGTPTGVAEEQTQSVRRLRSHLFQNAHRAREVNSR